MIEHLPRNVHVTVVAPAAQTDAIPSDRSNIVIRPFRYAPKHVQVLAHKPGGIPAALCTRKWVYLLLPGFLVSMFLNCLRYGRAADVLHANWAICGCIAGIVGKLLRVPVVTTLRGSDVARAQRSMLDKAILSLCFRWSDSIVTVSHAITNWTREQYPKHSNKVLTIENGVEDALLTLPAKREFSTSTPLRLLTVASLVPGKGIDQIITALQRLPRPDRVLLNIVGEGPERTRLAELTITLGLQNSVEFVGAIPPSAVATELAKAHVFVLASRSEGRPNVVLEAMAAALPVIATDIDGVRDIVEHENTGLLYDVKNTLQLADHISRMCKNDNLRQRLGENARRWIILQGLSWDNTSRQYANLYHRLATGIAARKETNN